MIRGWVLLSLAACAPKGAPAAAASAGEAPLPPLGKCPKTFGPAEIPLDRAQERVGTGATRFSELHTSVARPAEVCGVQGQVELLMRLTCDDGTNPYSSWEDAHDSRAGSVGAGGRCGTTIDLYPVKCKEAEYQVFIDLYACTEGESLF